MSIGKIREFSVTAGNWSLYVERLEMFFLANKVDKATYLPTLIAGIGDEAYELLSNLSSPKKPSELTYDGAVSMLRNHLQPKRSIMAERFKFRQRRQTSEENISSYLSELKKLAKYCEFESTLEENLRDQLVCGVKSDVIRQRLFAENDLTYTSAVKLSGALEAAERDAAVVEVQTAASGGHGETASFAGAGPAASAARVHAITSRQDGASKVAGQSYEPCKACGNWGHAADNCRYRRLVCGKCKEKGHIRRVCPRGSRRESFGKRRVNHVDAAHCESFTSSGSELEEELHQLSLNSYRPVSLPLIIDGIELVMEIDTGSALSCISKKTYTDNFVGKHPLLLHSDLVLKFYNGSKIKPLGIIKPLVEYNGIKKCLELYVIDGGTTSLLGRQWLSELNIGIPKFHCLHNINKEDVRGNNISCNSLSVLLNRYKELFSGGLGRFTGGRATLRLREGAVPTFHRARPLPYALRDQVDAELDAMLREGVIEPVDSSDWATPLVPVRKADGGLRICADYKVTLNPVLLIDRYPLPKIDDLLVKLNGSQLFSKIDLSQAYNQIELDSSKDLTVINTHRGLFKYNRLVFGLSSSPGIFQRIMAGLLGDIPGVEVFLDDVIIGTKGEPVEHVKTLEKVLSKLSSHGMKLKKNKCVFMASEVKYLGYIISREGIRVDDEKVAAIVKIPAPTNVTEIRSFLGLVNFYAKFVPNLSSILCPLYNLLKKGKAWNWDKQCVIAFDTMKKILTSAQVLMHYDPYQPLFLTCDASARGISGVLTQIDARSGAERPVVYVSRSLSSAEKHYSQIDREALAIVFCLQKLHQYLYGRQFTLRTDHMPLVKIFGPKHGIPAMAASRLQRWAIIVSAYTYDIEYVNTKDNGADGLSRLPLPMRANEDSLDPPIPEQTYLHYAHNELLLDYNTVKQQTLRDPMLSRVLMYIRDSWPDRNDIRELQPYFNRRTELYEELNCVMWGHRVVIPESCRRRVLEVLHESHMGIVKTKAMARSYVWWPGIDEAVEGMCRECAVCAAEADAPARAVAVWPWPSQPWARVHVDFLGPLAGRIYLIMVDARTKWLEVFPVPSTAAPHCLSRFNEVFARWGLPKQIVSDNGPPFTSKEVSEYLLSNGIEHIFSAPYHPSSNGAAENAVRSVKKVIKKALRQNLDINTFLNTYWLYYRNTEHCTTGVSPASLMIGRPLRIKLDAIRPTCDRRVNKAQERQGSDEKNTRRVQEGDKIWFRNYQGGKKWEQGLVTQRLGNTDYRVSDMLGRDHHKHIDQLRQRSRSSLVCPSAETVRSSSDPASGTNESGPAGLASPHLRDPTQRVQSNDSDDSESSLIYGSPPMSPVAAPAAGSPAGVAATSPPAAPPQPPKRPIRACRAENPPKYKL